MPLPSVFWAVRMLWQDANVAIGETYFNNAAVLGTPPLGLYNTALQLYKARSLLMGNSVVPVSFRISQVGLFRAYINSVPDDIIATAVGPIALTVKTNTAVVAAGGNNVVDGSSAQGPDSIIINYTGQSIQNHARHYFAGVPNVLIRTNPLGPWDIAVQSWGNLFNAYRNLLYSNGWCLRCRATPTIPNPPAGVTFGMDGTNTYLTVTCATIPGVTVNLDSLQIRGAKMVNKAYKSPNGTWPVIAASVPANGQTTYTLGNTQGVVFAQIVAGYGNAQKVDYTLSPITLATLGKEGSHKRGNRVLAGPGRRKTVQKIVF